MTLVPLKLPAGFYRNGTEYEGSYRWRDGNLVRWVDGSLRPVGGWQLRKSTFLNNVCRGLHAWQSNDGTAWIAGGSHDQICGMTGGGVKYNLTPDDLALGRESAAVGTGYGNGFYGTGYFGQPRPPTSASIPQEATTWQLDNFGQNLIGFHSDDGRLFEWDLSTYIGPELITNGDFATDSDWTKGTNWSIAGGVAEYQLYKPTIVANANPNVDTTSNRIVFAGHKFNDGDEVNYIVPTGQRAIYGLTAGTNYFVVNKLATSFQLAATSGGSAINLLPPPAIPIDADDEAIKDVTNNKIVASNPFADGDIVTYTDEGGVPIGGLTDNGSYYIVNRTATEFQLSDTSGGTPIDLTPDLNVDANPNAVVAFPLAFDVAVAAVGGNNIFTIYGGGLNASEKPTLQLVRGKTYVFDVSDATNAGHPLGFFDGATAYTSGVTVSGTEGQAGATVTFAVPTNAPANLTYQCTIHGANMGNTITTVDEFQDVNYTTDVFGITAHGFTTGRKVKYTNGGGSDIGGLTDGTEYFIVNSTPNTFKLSTSFGGSAINVTAPFSGLVLAVNAGADVIGCNNTFADGDEVQYFNGNGTSIPPLVSGQNYFIRNRTPTAFQLSETPTGAIIDFTGVGEGNNHFFTKQIGTAHNFDLVITSNFAGTGTYSPHVFTINVGNAHQLERQNFGNLEQTITGILPQTNAVTVDSANSSVVNVGSDTINVANTFSNGTKVRYANGGGTDIGGLVNDTDYFIISATASQFQLAAVAGGTAIDITGLGVGASHTITHNIGDDQDTFDLEITLVDPNDDADVTTVPDVKVKVTGVNTSTVYVHETLSVGFNIFRFGTDDTQALVQVIPQAYNTPNFDVDNISLKQKTVLEPIENAPINNKGMVVTEERFIFALGAGGNARKVQWCDKENNTVWAAAATNEAGDIELATVGQIMQGVRSRGQVLIITDTDAHTASYIGPPYVYGFQKIGQHCGAISRLSAVSTDYGVFWFGQETFHYFDGNSVQELPCEVRDYVFSDFNTDQQSKVWGMALGGENEIWWFYPSGNSIEIDRYVGYNYADKHWLLGNLSRTAGTARGVFANPLMTDHTTVTNLQNHEQGFNYDTSQVFCETGPISIGNGDNIMKVTDVIPDEKTQGNVDLKFKSKFYPNDTERTYGPFNPSNPTSVRFSGRQIKMRVEADSATSWNVGTMRLETKTGGRR